MAKLYLKFVDYAEFSRFHITNRSQGVTPPAWALDDRKVRAVLLEKLRSSARYPFAPIDKAGIRQMEKRATEVLCAVNKNARRFAGAVQRWGLLAFYASLLYRRHRLGLRYKDLAAIYELPTGDIKKYLYRLNRVARCLFPKEDTATSWARCRKPIKPRKRRELNVRQAWQMRQQGLTTYAIAEALGFKQRAVQSVLRRHRLIVTGLQNS
jgi:hypothetical protein